MPVIEVYADIWCPFAHVGLRTAARRLAELAPPCGPGLRVRAWPLELVNGAPLDPEATGRHAEELRAQVAPELFRAFPPDRFPSTTLPALALAACAYRTSTAVGQAVSLALRWALFEEGRDVASPAVLEEIRGRFGVAPARDCDEEEVVGDWRRGQARGVRGSPHFFCGERDVFCPLLRLERGPDARLAIEAQLDRLDGFLLGCLRPGAVDLGNPG